MNSCEASVLSLVDFFLSRKYEAVTLHSFHPNEIHLAQTNLL